MITGGGDSVRIKDIEGYKGDDNGFAMLYAAIWGKAVEDELRRQMTRLLIDTSGRLFSGLLKYKKAYRNTYAKVNRLVGLEYGIQGKRLVRELETLIDENKAAIKKAVQAKIYRESEAWPNDHEKDTEFEKEYMQIRDDILDTFSGRRLKLTSMNY